MDNLKVSTFYHFTAFSDLSKIKGPLEIFCKKNRIKGSIILAFEGINGTIAGKPADVTITLKYIRSLPGCNSIKSKDSYTSSMPFNRMKVRLKKEIVTMGQPNIDPTKVVGKYIAANDWNTFIEKNDVVVIDTRNNYEVDIGTFEGAINPNTESFKQFPEWWEKNKNKYQNKKIAMFCTGGIRCEKSSNYLLNNGIKDVYHLEGGILKYLENIEEQNSKWQGECYVFDHRVSVVHGLNEGSYDCCFACGRPITENDKKHPSYEYGVSCDKCINEFSENRKNRFRERQKQIHLSAKKGERHLG